LNIHPKFSFELWHWALCFRLTESSGFKMQKGSAYRSESLLTLGGFCEFSGSSARAVCLSNLGENGPRDFALSPIYFKFRPESRQDYPPNLSILISGGKENNCDALSNGE